MDKYFLTKDSIKVFYKIKRGNDKTIFLLHGLGGSFSGIKKIYDLLCKTGYTIIASDIRGHGLSEKPKKSKTTLHYIIDDFAGILEKEEIDKTIFVGHSFGSLIMPYFYEKYKNKLDGLVFISSNYSTKERYEKNGTHMYWYLMKILDKYPISRFMEDKGKHIDLSEIDWREDISPKSIVLLMKDIRQVGINLYIEFLKNIINYDNTKIIRSIKIPTLVIHGKKDIVFPVKRAQEMQRMIKGSELFLIDKMNHFPVTNCPEIVVDRILRFCEKTWTE